MVGYRRDEMKDGFQRKQTGYRKTALGLIGITEERGSITELFWEKGVPGADMRASETPLLSRAFALLEAYLSGEAVDWSQLPLSPRGTPFQLRVWEELKKIPRGRIRTYGQIAALVGNPRAARAVGSANRRNPIPIIIPCHRVVEAGGRLGGFLWGADIKRKLLALEEVEYDTKS
ncbi:MAG TPA: methylated-DNA--[protein]-cysteine S-methyltransferase [Verrucomicrobiota bacterium]|nr:methylated-DNA--[protein]-cysteine S-methyltransferase [Verrucomicrobiota bacterium]